MFRLHVTAKTYGQRPSSLVDIEDSWLALQFDQAVALVGITIENAAQEQTNTGTDKQPKYENKYSMAQLLDPDFRLPSPEQSKKMDGLQALKALGKRGGVKTYKVK